MIDLHREFVFEFDKSRPDYDPDLDFPPLKVRNLPETITLGPTRGNSLKAQMEELWQRKGVVFIAHNVCWVEKDGRITGCKRGRLLWAGKKPKIRRKRKSP